MQNESHHPKISLWVVAFALCALLQIFRGSIGDEIIFIGGTGLLITSTTIFARLEFPSHRIARGHNLDWSSLVLFIALAFPARHSPFDLAVFILVLPIVIGIAWGEQSQPKLPLTAKDKTTRFSWSAWAIAMCVWEFGANIAGQLSGRPRDFPTISVLVDPLLDTEIGQAGFVAVWLALGYYLLKSGVE